MGAPFGRWDRGQREYSTSTRRLRSATAAAACSRFGADPQALAVRRERHVALLVRAVDDRVVEALERRRRRMAEVVVFADGDDRHRQAARPRGTPAGRVGGAVVRDLEHRRPQIDAFFEEGRFARRLKVARKQEADVAPRELEHQRVVVRVGARARRAPRRAAPGSGVAPRRGRSISRLDLLIGDRPSRR